MAGTLTWALSLVDKLTGPAGKMAASVSNLEGKLNSLGSAAESIGGAFNAIKNSVIGDIAKKAGELVVAGAQLAIDASSFKEDSIMALKHLVGTQAEATALFEKADELAGRLGLEDAKVVGQLQKLIASGFSASTALAAVEAAANLAAARGEASAEAFTSLLSTIEAKGKFDTGAISKLAKAGVRTEDIYNQLAKTLHKSRSEIEAMVKAGKIDAATGIEAATAVINEKFGGAAAESANTFSKLLFRLKDALGDLFQDVDIGPLKDALKAVLTAINGPAGAEVKAGINHFFGAIFKVIGSLFDGPEGAKRLEETLHSAARAFELAAKVVEVAGPILVTMIQLFVDACNLANDGKDLIVGAFEAIASVFDFLDGVVSEGVALFVAGITALWDFLVGAVTGIVDTVTGLPESIDAALSGVGESLLASASGIGTSIIDGLVAGIVGGASAVVSAISSVASGAIDAAKSALGIHSPSDVFANLGHFTAEGFGEGLAANDSPNVEAAAMLDVPTVQGAAAAGMASGRQAAPAGDGGAKVIQIHVHGGDTDKVKRTVYEAIEAMGWA